MQHSGYVHVRKLFSQWVQTMYSAPTIFLNKNILFIIESQITYLFYEQVSTTTWVNITVKVTTKMQQASDAGFINLFPIPPL